MVVYDVGRFDSTAYIAMELVEGKSLRELMAGDRLSLKKTLQIGSQVADGLTASMSVATITVMAAGHTYQFVAVPTR